MLRVELRLEALAAGENMWDEHDNWGGWSAGKFDQELEDEAEAEE